MRGIEFPDRKIFIPLTTSRLYISETIFFFFFPFNWTSHALILAQQLDQLLLDLPSAVAFAISCYGLRLTYDLDTPFMYFCEQSMFCSSVTFLAHMPFISSNIWVSCYYNDLGLIIIIIIIIIIFYFLFFFLVTLCRPE